MKKKIANYSYQTWILIGIAIVIFGGAGIFAAKKLVWRSTETLNAKFDRLIETTVGALQSDEVQVKLNDLATELVKKANFDADDKQFVKNILQAMIIRLQDPCIFQMAGECSKEANEHIAKILHVDPAIIEEFDKKVNELDDKLMRGEIVPPSHKALLDQLVKEEKYADIARYRTAAKEIKQLDKQLKEDPRIQESYKKFNGGLLEALLKALQ